MRFTSASCWGRTGPQLPREPLAHGAGTRRTEDYYLREVWGEPRDPPHTFVGDTDANPAPGPRLQPLPTRHPGPTRTALGGLVSGRLSCRCITRALTGTRLCQPFQASGSPSRATSSERPFLIAAWTDGTTASAAVTWLYVPCHLLPVPWCVLHGDEVWGSRRRLALPEWHPVGWSRFLTAGMRLAFPFLLLAPGCSRTGARLRVGPREQGQQGRLCAQTGAGASRPGGNSCPPRCPCPCSQHPAPLSSSPRSSPEASLQSRLPPSRRFFTRDGSASVS